MSINIGPPAVEELRPRITVIGVGGAGGNAIANMIQANIEGVDFIIANTDAQALNNSIADHRIQLGPDITQGLGAGSRPEVGRAAAEETIAEIERALEGVHMCFIAAGMGGGTGTGAAPVIAKAARDKGVLTVGVVTKPFLFEGTRRMRSADAGIDELQKHVDTLIVIPNQNLFLVAKAETTFKEAFQLADEVLQQGVRSITDLMVMPGLINLDFADVRSVMGEMGKAMMGTGEASGENRALEASERAISNPLLDGVSMQGAKGVIISIIGGDDMKLLEVDEAANHIRDLVDPNANIIWGSAFNPDLQGKIRVSVVATGIEQTPEQVHEISRGGAFPMGGARGITRPGGVRSEPEPTPVASSFSRPSASQPANQPAAMQEAVAQPVANTTAGQPTAAQPAPVAARSAEPIALEPEPAGQGEPLELQLDAVAEGPAEPAPGRSAPAPESVESAPDADELLLEADRLAAEDTAAPAPARRRVTVQAEPERTPRLSGGGSTLFERMANLSRGGGKTLRDDDGDDDGEGPSLSIPRFLGRQNNQ
ncbi:MAG: cell division protein FtsZ [Pseudomonadota bacterium]